VCGGWGRGRGAAGPHPSRSAARRGARPRIASAAASGRGQRERKVREKPYLPFLGRGGAEGSRGTEVGHRGGPLAPLPCPRQGRWGEKEGGEEKRLPRLARAGTEGEELPLRRPVGGAVALPAAGSERPRENGVSCVCVFFFPRGTEEMRTMDRDRERGRGDGRVFQDEARRANGMGRR
jgi:hypothetical protein